MIYRIDIILWPDPEDEKDSPEEGLQKCIANLGHFLEPVDLMQHFGLPGPGGFNGDKGRFYFTKEGWQRIGKHVAAALQKQYEIRVQRCRNPTKGNTAYRDKYQVVLLGSGLRKRPHGKWRHKET